MNGYAVQSTDILPNTLLYFYMYLWHVLLVLFYGLHTSAVFAGVFYPFVNGVILVGY